MSLYRSFYNSNSSKMTRRTAVISTVAAFAFVAGAQSQLGVDAVKLTALVRPAGLTELQVPGPDEPVPRAQQAQLKAVLGTPRDMKEHKARTAHATVFDVVAAEAEAAEAAHGKELKASEGGEGHLYHLKPTSSLNVLATLTEPVAGEPTMRIALPGHGKAVPGHGPRTTRELMGHEDPVVVSDTLKRLAAASPPADNTHGKEGLTPKQKLRLFWVVMAIVVLLAGVALGAGYGILKGLEGAASVGVASQAA